MSKVELVEELSEEPNGAGSGPENSDDALFGAGRTAHETALTLFSSKAETILARQRSKAEAIFARQRSTAESQEGEVEK
ncbi:MAG: hypothetical protein ACPIOQ_33420 [Promethearchaeia archaeon]